jgi:hypothetical protein
MKKVLVELEYYEYSCSEPGCCFESGCNVKVNGKRLFYTNEDTETILEQVLEELGYKPEIITTYKK